MCSWSLQPKSPAELISKLREIGIPRVQLALDPVREQPDVWSHAGVELRRAGVEIVSGMIGFVGEDYSTMETIHATGGVAPDATWEQNLRNVATSATDASRLGISLVTFHAGFLPPDSASPDYRKMLIRLGAIADLFAQNNLTAAFETGQETAPELSNFLRQLNRPNVGVNFDPANIILYDNGDPISALRELLPWLRQIHIKDGRRTRMRGTWGEEVAAGEGEVPWREFFATLRDADFGGWCCIEREAGNQRVQDIQTAYRLVQRLAV